VLLILVLLTPWLAHLVRFGYAGVILALLALVFPIAWAVRFRRRLRRVASRA
jgi:hypothetical protein